MKGVGVALLLVLLASTIADSRAMAADPGHSREPASDLGGLHVDGPSPVQFVPDSEAHALLFDAALTEAFKHPADMGYPWLDISHGTLELRYATPVGQKIAESGLVQFKSDDVDVRVVPAAASIQELDDIGDGVTRLASDVVPDADLIWLTVPDQKNERIVVAIRKANDELAALLTERYGADRVAFRVVNAGPAYSGNRNDDFSPYWGGARINVPAGHCTSGFAWNVGGVNAMLTAAHCAPGGGTVEYDSHPGAAWVQAGYEENWNSNLGTQYYTGQSTYRGDVALARYVSGLTSPRIYNGDPGTSTNTAVGAMAFRRRQTTDGVYIDGTTTGEWYGNVTDTGVNINYRGDGPNVWARNVVIVYALGWECPTHGDSGGPAYKYQSDGDVTAVGIYSGGLPEGLDCFAFMTDIYDPAAALPGSLKTT